MATKHTDHTHHSKDEVQSWTLWGENVGFKSPEHTNEGDSSTKQSEAKKLKKEDMGLFGFCPSWDNFYLVVCEKCGQVVKPQAFKSHLEAQHGSVRSSCPKSSEDQKCEGFQSTNHVFKSQCNLSSTKMKSSIALSSHPLESRPHTKLSGSGVTNITKSKGEKPGWGNKGNKNHTLAPVVFVERIPDNAVVKNVNSSPTLKKELPSPQKPPPLLIPHLPSTCLTALAKTTITAVSHPGAVYSSKLTTTMHHHPTTLSKDKQILINVETKKISGSSRSKKMPRERKLLLCKDREYDPNIHCGVIISETGKPCTHSLTCKTHPVSMRRKVSGRRKKFDELLADHRASKEATLKAVKASATRTDSVSYSNQFNSSGLQTCVSQTAYPVCSKSSTSASVSQKVTTVPAVCKPISRTLHTKRIPSVFVEALGKLEPMLSAEDVCVSSLAKEEEKEEQSLKSVLGPDNPYIKHHPRPAAICTFGLRQLGNGMFLCDRRWDLQRAAFRAICTDRSTQPPPLKKLCVESQLPPVPEPENDPYDFTCTDSAVQEAVISSSNKSNVLTTLSNGVRTNVASSHGPQQIPRPVFNKVPPSHTINHQKSLKPKPSGNKSTKSKDSILLHTFDSSPAKKTKTNGLNVKLNQSGPAISTDSVCSLSPSVMTLEPGDTITLNSVNSSHTISLPFSLSMDDSLAALSKLHLVSSVGNGNTSSAVSSGAPSSDSSKNQTFFVTEMDIVNNQLPSLSKNSMLASSVRNKEVMVNSAFLVNQLAAMQSKQRSTISNHSTKHSSCCSGKKSTKHNVRTYSSGATQIKLGSNISKAKSKNQKLSSKSVLNKTAFKNHTTFPVNKRVEPMTSVTSGNNVHGAVGMSQKSLKTNSSFSTSSVVSSSVAQSVTTSWVTVPNGLTPHKVSGVLTSTPGTKNGRQTISSPSSEVPVSAVLPTSVSCELNCSTLFNSTEDPEDLGLSTACSLSSPSGTVLSQQSVTYQQVFTSQMLSPAELSQLQVRPTNKQKTTPSTTSSLKLPLVASSHTSSSRLSSKNDQKKHYAKTEDTVKKLST
ncbi:ataxin-7-like protein 1 [Limulus polyphemus]|uniref:Ataxin-7-like protein 1 n=1 Tax=Limulus polyphemus TaxID=6850 RepID=A0ABM1SYJ4_LIMPO|nr:ataxin-7-like protein 1 [Limulus polyphemus]